MSQQNAENKSSRSNREMSLFIYHNSLLPRIRLRTRPCSRAVLPARTTIGLARTRPSDALLRLSECTA